MLARPGVWAKWGHSLNFYPSRNLFFPRFSPNHNRLPGSIPAKTRICGKEDICPKSRSDYCQHCSSSARLLLAETMSAIFTGHQALRSLTRHNSQLIHSEFPQNLPHVHADVCQQLWNLEVLAPGKSQQTQRGTTSTALLGQQPLKPRLFFPCHEASGCIFL